MLTLVCAPAGAQTRTGQQVAAGTLLARTTGEPWRLVFLERSGRTDLSGAARRRPWLPQRLRLGPCHPGARGPRSGRAYVATLATDDSLGRRLALRIEPDGEG